MATLVAVLIASLNPFNSGPGTSTPGTGGAPDGTAGPSPQALADIPADYLNHYMNAAPLCPGLHWSILAGIGKVESDHGRSNLPGVHSGTNAAGAKGPMQFLQTTWNAVIARHPLPGRGALNPPSPYNPADAIPTAANLLCDNGARDGQDIYSAIWSYNHDSNYVTQVLEIANRYAAATPNNTTPPGQPDNPQPGTPPQAQPAPTGPGATSAPKATGAFVLAGGMIHILAGRARSDLRVISSQLVSVGQRQLVDDKFLPHRQPHLKDPGRGEHKPDRGANDRNDDTMRRNPNVHGITQDDQAQQRQRNEQPYPTPLTAHLLRHPFQRLSLSQEPARPGTATAHLHPAHPVTHTCSAHSRDQARPPAALTRPVSAVRVCAPPVPVMKDPGRVSGRVARRGIRRSPARRRPRRWPNNPPPAESSGIRVEAAARAHRAGAQRRPASAAQPVRPGRADLHRTASNMPGMALSWPVVNAAAGLGRQMLGPNPTEHERLLAADLDHLGMQVTKETVLQIRNVLLGASRRMYAALDTQGGRTIRVGPPGGDPISPKAADELNRKADALRDEYRAIADGYRRAGDNLTQIARNYGYTEQAIADSFRKYVTDNRDTWARQLQQNQTVAGLPEPLRMFLDAPPSTQPPPRSSGDLFRGGLE
jgi:hypothetical protein